MPPLLLDDEEAIAIAVGLRTAARASITGIEETSLRALVKLEQVLPARLRRRVSALGTRDDHAARRRPDGRPPGPHRDRGRLPRIRVPALRLPQPRRRREPPRGRGPLRRQPGPALVPGRVGSRPRGLAHLPRRPDGSPRRHRRPLSAPRAAGEGPGRVSRAEPERRPEPLRGPGHAPRPRGGDRERHAGQLGNGRADRRGHLRVPDRATTSSRGSRCGSRCSAWTSTSTNRPS